MKDIVDKIIDFIIEHEGYITADPLDSGGYTVFGITSKYNPEVCDKLKRLIMEYGVKDAKEKCLEVAKDFYRKQYKENRFYMLPPVVAAVVFDSFVNMGYEAVKILQKVINEYGNMNIAVDGIIGNETSGAVNKFIRKYGLSTLLLLYFAKRVKYYTSLTTFDYFGKGWINRVADLMVFVAKETSNINIGG